MRHPVAPVLCATMLIGAALVSGCGSEPPPPPSTPLPPPIVEVAPKATATPETAPPPAPRSRRQRAKVTEFQVEANGIKLAGPVVFEAGSDKLSPESDQVLEMVHDFLDAKPEVNLLRIEGHMDNAGRPADNLVLSQKRAMSVARWLVGVGIKCERLIAVGFGDTKPLADNTTPENRMQNRRVAFYPAVVNGKPIDGLLVDGGGKVAGDPCH